MPNYQHGKIYKMVSLVDDYFYIGATTIRLSQRRAQHKNESNRYLDRAMCAHFNNIGWNNCRIVLLENYPCESKEELMKKGFEYIQANNCDKLLNIQKYIGKRCEHNREASKCKECGGSQICSHNREKRQCKEYGGNGICEHNCRKSGCKKCNGEKYCCYECEKSFSSSCSLTKHEQSKIHKDTYNVMFEECFG